MTPPARFANHWYPRPGQRPGLGYLTFHLLPRGASAGWPDLRGAVERDQAALRGLPGLGLVPAPWLHLTVQGAGYAAQLPGGAAAALAGRAAERLAAQSPVRLTFSPAAEVHREGVLYTGSPAEQVARLRAALRAAVRDVAGAAPGSDDEPVWPHLSIAYADADSPTAPAVLALAAASAGSDTGGDGSGPGGRIAGRGRPGTGGQASAAAAVVEFGAVSLIELRTEGHRYVWDLIADIPIGARG